ncbi:g136 [Coccomyxa elongata]
MVQPLTPYLHIMGMQRHDRCHMESTARALLAYRITVNLLNTYCEQLMQASYQVMQQPAVQLQLAQQVWMGQHTSLGVAPRELVVAGMPWRLQNPALRI